MDFLNEPVSIIPVTCWGALEFSNPFAKLGDGSLNRFKNFIDNAVKYTNELLSKIDKTHPNGLFNRNDDIQNKIKEKQIVYSDWG